LRDDCKLNTDRVNCRTTPKRQACGSPWLFKHPHGVWARSGLF
jgi:hypothetical protein